MKRFICLSVVLLLAVVAAAPGANVTVALENFETGTVGHNLNQDGWHGQRGPGDELFTTGTPYTAFSQANNTNKLAQANGFPDLMYKPFNTQNTIADTDTDIFIKADLYTGSCPIWFAPHIGGQSTSPYPNTPIVGENQANWDIWRADNWQDLIGDKWTAWSGNFEVALQIKVNTTDVTLSTGTLYYRPLGTSTWIKDATLRDVIIGLTSTSKPSLWDSWWMYGMYNGAVDNLTLGKGTDIPDAWQASQPGPPAPDGIKETEDFESGSLGYGIDSCGWLGQQPNYCNFQVALNWASPGGTGLMAAADGVVPPNQAYKPFASPSGISLRNTDVYVKADFMVDMPAADLWIGTHNGGQGGTFGPYFGTVAHNVSGVIVSTTWDLQLPGGAEIFGDPITPSAYQAVLQMSINQTDVSQSTGTLYYRPFGTAAWVKDSILQNVNLHLNAGNNPQTWDSWYMAGLYYGGMDNLALGVGTGASLSCVPPVGDLNGDCTVNWVDFATLASQWLQCTAPNQANCH